MTKVLHLIDTYRIGGPGKTILNSARLIDRSEFEVHVASFTSVAPGRNEFADAVRQAGIPYLELREERRLDLSHLTQLRAYLRREGIQILHTHGYRTDVLGYVASRGLPTAIVTTHHGWIRNNRRQELLTRLARRVCARLDGVELVSEQLRVELPAHVRDSARVAVVHNGIVLDDYEPQGMREQVRAAHGISPGETLIGIFGRLSVEKGCLEAVDALQAVVAGRPSVRAVFVGEGPLRDEVQRRIEAHGLARAVQIVPHQRRLQPFYEAIDMLLSPSHTEGLSNVILEALACRRPVVATRVGGTPEILADGVSGLLVAPRRPSALAAAVEQVLNDEALKQRLIQGGLARVRNGFSFAARMRLEENFYRRVARDFERGRRRRKAGLLR